jgi:cytochrome P450
MLTNENLNLRIERTGKSFLEFKRDSNTRNFPEDFADYIRTKGEVFYWPTGGFHVVTRAELAKEILTSDNFSADRSQFFISRMPNVNLANLNGFFSVVSKMMVMSDGKQHTSRRRAAGVGINEDLIRSIEPKLRQSIIEMLNPLQENGKIEWVANVARILPQIALSHLFGIPKSDQAFFNKCAVTMTAFFGGAVEYTNAVAIEVNQAALELQKYFRNLISERRQDPMDDFFSHILKRQSDFNVDDEELIAQAVMMLVAGQVTTTDQICNNLFLMLSEPGLYTSLSAQPHLLPTATEEFKRFDPAVTFLFRVAKADTQVGHQPVKKGETVFISNHCINRDPKMFEKPNVLNIHRENNKHFAYGHGAHYCLGARLGRVQMHLLFENLVENFPSLSLDPRNPAIRDHYSLSFSGFKTIDLVSQ